MMNPMAKIIVNNVPKSFENVNRIVFSPIKKGTKNILHLSRHIIYSQIKLKLH